MKDNFVNSEQIGEVNGEIVHCITLKNGQGSQLQVLTYGAIWHSFELFDKDKKPVDVVVAPKLLEDYILQTNGQPYFFGATIGRFAGRIKAGKFEINGKAYQLEEEDGVHLHGGSNGLHTKIWQVENMSEHANPSVTLSHKSRHMEDGYPGNIEFLANYTLTEDNAVLLEYKAKSDQDTILNMTNHVYFNLGRESMLKQRFQICADAILETDHKLLPTGQLKQVADSPYDFREQQKLEKIESVEGLDTCFVLNEEGNPNISLDSDETGIRLEVETNQPSVVVFAPKKIEFVGNPKDENYAELEFPAICLETQGFPDAPNQEHFPSTLLKKGEHYHNKTQFKFSIA